MSQPVNDSTSINAIIVRVFRSDYDAPIRAVEGDEVAGNDAYRLTALGRDEDFALEHVGALGGAEIDREARNFLFPDVPAGDAQFLQFFLARVFDDNDFAHDSNPVGYDDALAQPGTIPAVVD